MAPCFGHSSKNTVPDRSNLTGNVLVECLGNINWYAKGMPRDRKSNAKGMPKICLNENMFHARRKRTLTIICKPLEAEWITNV